MLISKIKNKIRIFLKNTFLFEINKINEQKELDAYLKIILGDYTNEN